MFRLRAFGGAVVEGESGALAGRAAHRRRLALLALLSTAPGGMLGREKLATYLWPERDSERARHGLSESLYVLRRALGEDAFLAAGDEVGLNPAVLSSDVTEFQALIEAGDVASAVELYRGPFLDGFFVDDAPDFERWMEAERERLARAFATALEQLAEEREAAGDWVAAVARWRRLAAHDPYSSRIALRLMLALDAAGERGAALCHAAAYAAQLRADLGAEPEPEVVALAARLRAEPAMHSGASASPTNARVAPPGDADALAPRAVPQPDARAAAATGWPEPSPVAAPPPLHKKRPAAYLTLVAALVVLGVGSFYLRPADGELPAGEPAPHPTRIAVLYFDDYSPEGALGYLATGLTASLIHELSQNDELTVISEDGVRPFRQSSVPVDSIARALTVGTLVSGSVGGSEDRVRVNVRVIDAATGVTLQSHVQERPWDELFSLIDEVVREVSASLRRELGRNVQVRGWRASTKSTDAWQFVYQAEELRQSARALERAGDHLTASARLSTADSLLARAEALDLLWTEPVLLRGWIAQSRGFSASHPARRDLAVAHRWFSAAFEHAQRALALEPNNARALELRGVVRYRSWLIVPPEDQAARDALVAAAESDLRAAVAADPTRQRAWSSLSIMYHERGDLPAAKLAAEYAYRADAYAHDVHQTVASLFETSFELGQDRDAARWCDEMRTRFQAGPEYANCALQLIAWAPNGRVDPAEGWRIVEKSLTVAPPPLRSIYRPRLEMLMAGVLARAGMADSARAVIQRARSAEKATQDLLQLEAAARVLLDEPDQAVVLLREYAAAYPELSVGVLRGRRFQSLRERGDLAALLRQP